MGAGLVVPVLDLAEWREAAVPVCLQWVGTAFNQATHAALAM